MNYTTVFWGIGETFVNMIIIDVLHSVCYVDFGFIANEITEVFRIKAVTLILFLNKCKSLLQ